MDYILETQHLTKTYSGKNAAKDINIHIAKGDISGLSKETARARPR